MQTTLRPARGQGASLLSQSFLSTKGDRSIKQIADELGFCDVFHSSKAFKQVVGTTPSEYRWRVRGG
jgi:AraC-like DNA-binding protein